MKNEEKTIVNRKNAKIILILIILTMIIFIPFLKIHYATDTYYIIYKGYKNYVINNSLKDGRIIMAIIGMVAEILHIPYSWYIVSLTVLALITSCISVVLLYLTIQKYKKTENKKQEVCLLTICYFTIFNFMYIENMLFVECFAMALSVLFYFLSAKQIVEKGKKYLLLAGIFAILGVVSYQGTVSMYIITIFVLSILKNKEVKSVIKDLAIGAIIMIFGISIQFFGIKIFEKIFNIKQTRISKNIWQNLYYIICNIIEVISYTGFVFPKNLFIIFLVIIEFVFGIKSLNQKDILIQWAIIFVGIISAIVPSIISTTAFFSARIRYSIGTIIGYLYIYFYAKTDIFQVKNILNTILINIFIVYGTITVINYISIMNNTLKVNEMDKQSTLEIYSYIEEQEKTIGTNITKVAIVKGKNNNKAYYPELKYLNSVLSWSAIRTEWSIVSLLNMYSQRNFEEKQPTQTEIQYYMENVDPKRDYLCVNDTIYVSYYME